jgi:hypothetical protein
MLSFHNGYVIELTVGHGINGYHDKDRFLGAHIQNIQIRVYVHRYTGSSDDSSESGHSDDEYYHCYDADDVMEVVLVNLRLPNGKTIDESLILTTYYNEYDSDTIFKDSITNNTVDIFAPLTATKRAR